MKTFCRFDASARRLATVCLSLQLLTLIAMPLAAANRERRGSAGDRRGEVKK